MSIQEIARLTEPSGLPELGFVQREATPEAAMQFGIQLHVAGVSLAATVSVLASLSLERCRTTVHDWMQTAGRGFGVHDSRRGLCLNGEAAIRRDGDSMPVIGEREGDISA